MEDRPDDVGVFVFLHLFEQRDLAQRRHGHALFGQRHAHLLQRHHLAVVGRVARLVHRPVRTCKAKGGPTSSKKHRWGRDPRPFFFAFRRLLQGRTRECNEIWFKKKNSPDDRWGRDPSIGVVTPSISSQQITLEPSTWSNTRV